MRRHVKEWTVLMTEAAWKRWVKKNCLYYEGSQAPTFPCLARSLIDGGEYGYGEYGYGEYLTLSEVEEMRAILEVASLVASRRKKP